MADLAGNGTRRAQLDFFARCDQAFTPFAPINLPEFFAGRSRHIERLETEIASPGRHVAIFGERGVGKTSLAKLAYFFLRQNEEETHFVNCTSASTFDTIFSDVLASAGVEAVLDGYESERTGQMTLGVPAFGASIGTSRRHRRTFRRVNAGSAITPRFLLTQFGQSPGLIVIDEYDRVSDAQTHTRVAELIKAFSDARARTKIMIIGVAETLTQLIGEHESLSRSLAQIKLDRMSDDELLDIVERGCQHLEIAISSPIRLRIARLADGFPYFVHLLCRHACYHAPIDWFRKKSGARVIGNREYQAGLQDAIANAENSLEESYERGVITTRRRSEMYANVLGAIAMSNDRDIQVQEIARNLALLKKDKVRKPATFSHHLGELSGEKRGNILLKIRDGYYKFRNPLLRPYIRLKLEFLNWSFENGQMEFPFMLRG